MYELFHRTMILTTLLKTGEPGESEDFAHKVGGVEGGRGGWVGVRGGGGGEVACQGLGGRVDLCLLGVDHCGRRQLGGRESSGGWG